MASDHTLKIRFVSESAQFLRDIAQADRSFTGLFANIKRGIAQGIGQQQYVRRKNKRRYKEHS